MTGEQGAAALVGIAIGSMTCLLLVRGLTARPPSSLVRVNYRGLSLPAVLGPAVAGGGLFGLGAAWFAGALLDAGPGDVGWATLAIVGLLGAGGAADDLRGDESARGFKGHIRAALDGKLTGGTVKIVAGAIAGLVAGSLVASGWNVVAIALLVALTANLLNLLDRAPGRASKVALAVAAPLLVLGAPAWGVSSAGIWGAAAASLPADLRERAMLGDAGANVLGGIAGLGLGLALDGPSRLAALLVVLALNGASERWSFSEVIENNGALSALDRAGRVRG